MARISASVTLARRLEGKVAIITGGARGLGEQTAKLFSKHGAKVLIADKEDELGKSVCKDIGGPDMAAFVHCDVSKESDVKAAVDMTVNKFGKLDVMISNAAIAEEAKLNVVDNDVAAFEKVISTNLTGVFLCSKHAARVMIPNQRGSIISVGSACSSVGGIAPHAYTSSKHAIIGLTKNLAVELGKYGIRVNCVSPYFIPTPLTLNLFKFQDESDYSSVYTNLHGQYLQPKDVAEALLYVASDESRYVSGHNLVVDGGFIITNPAFGTFARARPI